MIIGKEAMRQARGLVVRTTLAISLLAAKPLSDLDHTSRVLAAARGQEVSCYEPMYPEQDVYPYDAIVVPGSGVQMSLEGHVVPDYFEQLRLEAAAIAVIRKKAPGVVLLDGVSSPQIDPFINRTYLQKEIQKLSEGTIVLPDNAVIVENHSINTATNMQRLSELAVLYNLRTFLLITNEFQIRRAEIFACAYGNNAYPVAAEGVIADFDPERRAYLDELYASPSMKPIMLKEEIGIAVSLYDPQGYIPTWVKQVLPNR
ncbi:hypothetical protein A2973_03460 [Candidatus Gottesmanbacteria bacterium RIFCSPLOWO2_01_FULL_49_10]|uniref:DUF218 domain-containing protein n=1 Tax=Candidatus Gottesmanbacteria bacterium RIFCSPLOWO2_01_FULL_49_10 TaxID=1798396 RepID=A0A1F6AWQ4_9BACT|nr:MAG: hypothetical protein UY10_C0008G0009 [Microgenomates group bacterium GW2011_GWA2_47_8]OGG28757.1 MAG: hypothetical protein A2973_03460 [Candidatus Gottesmanbacteria bacterium RIFCSPLOWO2_01_FULL_49_10]